MTHTRPMNLDFITKWILTGGLTLALLFQIQTVYRESRPIIGKFFSTFSVRVNPEKVALKTKIGNLNHFRPELEPLVAADPHTIPQKTLVACEEYYRRAVEYFPQQGDSYGVMGFCQYYLGKKKEALVSYTRAVNFNPRLFWNAYNLALLYFEEEHFEQAAYWFEKSLGIRPEETIKSILTSRIYQQLWVSGRFEQAKFQELAQGLKQSQKFLVLSLYKAGRFKETLRLCQRLLNTIGSDQNFYLFYAGLSAFQQDDFKSAVQFFQASLKDDPTYEVYQELGLILKSQGQEGPAQAAFESAQLLKERGHLLLPLEIPPLRLF